MLAVAALGEGSVNTILEACATLAKLDYVPDLSSHSLRRGMATSAHRAGADFRDIKKQGGWRNDGTVQGYIEEAKAGSTKMLLGPIADPDQATLIRINADFFQIFQCCTGITNACYMVTWRGHRKLFTGGIGWRYPCFKAI